jgi:predicted N-acetyltransferase YhbS
MNFKYLSKLDKIKIEKLFRETFAFSEGEKEGCLIGELSAKLSEGIDNQNIFCLGVFMEKELVGSIFFTKLYFKEKIKVYMLAPVAVGLKYQKKGVGSSLINFGINELKNKNVDIIVTYGDPLFYSKVGFQKITEKIIKAPLELSMPQGWLGQSLKGQLIPVIKDRPTCVKAFDNQVYW